MFGKTVYYYKDGDDFYIYEPNTDSDAGELLLEMNLYKNEKLLYTETGLTGEFVLKGDNAVLKIKNTMTKSINELFIDGNKVDLIKIKEKKLREILTAANIFNPVNPTQEELDAAKFDFKRLLIPGFLLVVGIILQYSTRNLERPYEFIFVIPTGIAGWMIGNIIDERYPWLGKGEYGKLGYACAGIVLGGVLGEFLFQFIP